MLRSDAKRIAVSMLLVAAVLLALAPTPQASADSVIGEPGEGAGQISNPQGLAVDTSNGNLYVADSGNRRVDVFDSAGDFVRAFGWGVADGASAELQTCTTSCFKGLSGAGAGEFSTLGDIALDTDPSSPSFHDVYVLDNSAHGFENRGETGFRVQKFKPTGEFVQAWGGGVITGGAAGTGDVTSGSTTVAAVKTTAKTFEAGQEVSGAGIPAGTRIATVGSRIITLSKAATANGTGVALTVAEGVGNVVVNEQQKIVTDGSSSTYGIRFGTPNPSSSEAETAGATIHENAPASGPGSVQAALEGLSNIGPGNVAVTGPAGGPYTIEFKGPRFADTDVEQLRTFGSPVEMATARNGHSAAEICTAAIAASCASGVEGGGEGQFSRDASLAVGPGGTVHVADSVLVGTELSGHFEDRLQKFEPSGSFVEQLALSLSEGQVDSVTVDSTGDFYVSTVSKPIRKYGPGGVLLNTLPAQGIGALAIDSADDLFSAETEGSFAVIGEHESAGVTLRRFGYGVLNSRPAGLAPFHSLNGDVYATDGNLVRYLSFPPPGPIVAAEPCKALPLHNTDATLNAEVNPEGEATTFHFEYVDQAHFESGGFSNPATESTPESGSIGSDFLLHKATAVIAVVPSTKYHCRVVASSVDGESTGDEGTFTSLPPFEILTTWSSQVGTEAATLNASVNPLGIPATGYFEYVDDATFQASVFAEAKKAPESGEIDFGDGATPNVGGAQLKGLSPATGYHYRVVVVDSFFSAGIASPEATFHTFSGVSEVADERAYELVSPPQKNSAEVAVPSAAGGLAESGFERARILASSSGGEAITYTSFTAFGEDAKGAPGASQYLSKRTSGGWTTEDITPFGVNDPLRPPYVGFTPDLAFGAFAIGEPALTEDAVDGSENLYLRNNTSGGVRALTTEPPQVSGGEIFCTGFAGATTDGQHAAFAANGAFAGAPKAKGFSLYEWSATAGPSLLSVLPGGAPAAPSENGVGAKGGACAGDGKIVRHALSADGSRVFWTYLPTGGETQLLARLGGTQTIELDATQGGTGPSGGGRFWAASASGSKVLFTDSNPLTPTSGPPGTEDLYLYDFGAPEGERLSDLTPGSLTPGAEPTAVQGLLGAGEDGAYVYFAANGVLASGASSGNCSGEGSNGTGACSLYLYHQGEGVRFIARVSGHDDFAWSRQPKEQTARVAPDGLHLAFTSIASLTDYDNTVEGAAGCERKLEEKLEGDPSCAEAYLYSVEGEELACASCNPSGSRPTGPALLPSWSNPYEQPRYLSDDGSRLFFDSLDSLDSADTDGKLDVYEFERSGAGSCNPGSASFVEESGGCVFLVSTGTSEDNSYLIDASSDGRDVFLSTRQPLLGIDDDQRYDVYDYRSRGGFPELASPPPCEGEACRPGAPLPPGPASPATGTFTGPGNVKPKKHHKKKQRGRHGKRRSGHRALVGGGRRAAR